MLFRSHLHRSGPGADAGAAGRPAYADSRQHVPVSAGVDASRLACDRVDKICIIFSVKSLPIVLSAGIFDENWASISNEKTNVFHPKTSRMVQNYHKNPI